ncbi:baculoviral IAP repeat-containing protein 7 isoform X1 [Prionailurus bengalensis]|uniref:baculoviral IAP repeat-containing protein 7 isoform X1 n=1 Tax=Prionailurus bengalensis TaxID=37029 RepID=UPI001CAA05AC|nr:baculoviral IAP repeat-containing protein 7 isoform X1 [Prionailurus bengalensis]
MGPEDRAKCRCCGPERSCWVASRSPTRAHCGPLSLCGSIVDQDTSCALSWGGRDHTDGQILGQLRPLAEEEEEEEEEGARAAPATGPAFPGMGSEELRLASFYDWPLSAVVRPEPLAAAGFFHTGRQDQVRCFFCRGGLQSWEQGDDPWTEHAKWFPRCGFLLQTKGRDFVCSVQESCYHPLGSWDQSEEPADSAPTAPSDARGRQEWPAWSRCPAVQAALCMGFGQNQVRRLVQRKYLWAVPASVSASQLVADLLQEDDGGPAAEARGACPPLPHALPWHTVPTAQGPEGPSWWRGLWGVRAAWAPPEPDLACGAPWVGSHFPWGLLVCPTPPTAPVHVGPELPTPRREAQSEGATQPGAQDAQEQLRRLQEERTCKVCLDHPVCTVLVPCGHLVCADCAPVLRLCPLCRAPIRSCVRTFLP